MTEAQVSPKMSRRIHAGTAVSEMVGLRTIGEGLTHDQQRANLMTVLGRINWAVTRREEKHYATDPNVDGEALIGLVNAALGGDPFLLESVDGVVPGLRAFASSRLQTTRGAIIQAIDVEPAADDSLRALFTVTEEVQE